MVVVLREKVRVVVLGAETQGVVKMFEVGGVTGVKIWDYCGVEVLSIMLRGAMVV
jgi:hypothetical protein